MGQLIGKNLKKILLVTRNFPPLTGGMERLNLHISKALSVFFDVSIAGPEGSRSFHSFPDAIEFPPQPLYKYVIVSIYKTLFLARKVKPDVVFCGSGAAILAGYLAARLNSAKLVCYLHGLDIIVDSIIYRYLFLPLIKKSDMLLVNSNHTLHLALNKGIQECKLKVLSPGTSIPNSNFSGVMAKKFRDDYGVGEAPFLLIVGRMTQRKGTMEFVENVMPRLLQKIPELRLIVIGEEATQAMKKIKGVKQALIDKINELRLNEHVKLLGKVDDETLAAAYFAAGMLVFPVLNLPNDVEGFGMVSIEAAAHGLPTIAFEVGGIPDAVDVKKSGWLISPGDYIGMSEIIISFFNSDRTISASSCREFAADFEWSNFEKRLAGYMDLVASA